MRLTRLGHSCIRLETEQGRIVIDPGGFAVEGAMDGADAVLITQAHADHFDEVRVRAAAEADRGLQIWTVSAVADVLIGLGEQVHVVGHGDAFSVAGFSVEAHGTWHARIHPDIPAVMNTGFLVDQTVFHPGDALTLPGKPIDTLTLPIHAPWSRISDLIDWVREVSPRRAVGVHDGFLSSAGLTLVDGLLGEHGPGIGAPYRRDELGAHVVEQGDP